jgi:tRNA A37 threonylcarbamoyladenosine dehydratase
MANGERFSRIVQLLGQNVLEQLSKVKVGVFGLGAVGSYAVEALARAGIGAMRLVDFDVIKHSNFNRQLYALECNVGRSKVEIAIERVLEINPACRVEALNEFVDAKNVERFLSQPLDVVIDAIDSVNPKVALLGACKKNRLKVVSSMGAATRLHPDFVRIGDISETTNCPLARFIRKRLKKYGVESGIRCIYSIETPRNKTLPLMEEGEEFFVRGRKRKPIGSMSYMTGIFGLLAAYEALKLLGIVPSCEK